MKTQACACSSVVGEAKWNVIIWLLLNNHKQYSYWNISLFYYNMSGHKRTRFCPDMIVTTRFGYKHVWAQTCVGTIVCGHKRVRSQTCVGTIMCGHNRVWAQSCMGPIVWSPIFLYNFCIQLIKFVIKKFIAFDTNDYICIRFIFTT